MLDLVVVEVVVARDRLKGERKQEEQSEGERQTVVLEEPSDVSGR